MLHLFQLELAIISGFWLINNTHTILINSPDVILAEKTLIYWIKEYSTDLPELSCIVVTLTMDRLKIIMKHL